jgi:Immunoglobulin V-set domain
MLIYLQVSWVRRFFYEDSSDEAQQRQELQLLTVGTNTFVADLRYSVDFQFPNNFRLLIQNVTKRDEGIYECQVGFGNSTLKHIASCFRKFNPHCGNSAFTDFDSSTEGYPVLSASER